MWLRTDVVLVRGETPTPLERLFIFADVANGIGSIRVQMSLDEFDVAEQLTDPLEGVVLALDRSRDRYLGLTPPQVPLTCGRAPHR